MKPIPHTTRANDIHEPPPLSRIIILGAGRALGRDLPPALVSVDGGARVMDWLLEAFSVIASPLVHLVGGYKAGEIRTRYPHIDLIHNTEWETTGPAASLAIAPLSSKLATYVTYSDVVFRPQTVEKLEALGADIVLAVDRTWRTRYDSRGRAELDRAEKIVLRDGVIVSIGKHVATDEADAEFVGLVKLSSATAALLGEWVRSDQCSPSAALPELIGFLLKSGASADVVDVGGDWAELNLPQDLARFVLGTKAESLARLAPLVRLGCVNAQVAFTQREWDFDAEDVLSRIAATFGDGSLIIRSSALSEDQWTHSAAGAYESVLGVNGGNVEQLRTAVESVLDSYAERDPADQVLVQHMLTDIRMSGVVMTRTPGLGAPYRVFSFDDTSRRTDTVTGGIGAAVRTVFQHRGDALPKGLPPELQRLLNLVLELEELVGHDSLDIEFAFTGDGAAHVLQVRPISLAGLDVIDDRSVARGIVDAKDFFEELQQPAPFIVGSHTQLSVMSDWNPAEIIGTKPKRLAFSLYRYLITDEVWARQRAEYGYRDVRPCNLLVDVLGHPYVDVRATFNSFVPANLPEPAAERLVEHCLDYLAQHPELHDKVEFAVLFTCMTFDFGERVGERLKDVLSEEEIETLRAGLTEITREGMRRCATDYAEIQTLGRRFDRIMSRTLGPLERAYVLLEELRRVGTPLFSHLARAGFVAANLLRSLPSTGCVEEGCDDDFVATLSTVSSTIQEDGRRVSSREITWEAFVQKYGHLRPGTYDITSPCYASAPEFFLRPIVVSATAPKAPQASHPWNEETRKAISRELGNLGLDPDPEAFERFLAYAIEGRELCKFVFTRHLSAALEAIAEFGRLHGLEREDLAHVRIGDLWNLRSARHLNVAETLHLLARQGEEAFRLTEAVCLPGQIFSPADFGCFEQLKATPNFVTGKTARAPIVCLSAASGSDQEVEGRIVVIPNADPGFDWLFSRHIVGLITMYGGGNSHMAIRSAEFGLPAAIGVGELLYEEISRAEVIELDCGSRYIRVVR